MKGGPELFVDVMILFIKSLHKYGDHTKCVINPFEK